jgi:catechol 2,3-dioxygenase-like lactoylglutathione lyase family enzyme
LIYELNHFGIVIKDLDKSLAFYQDILGAKVVFTGFIESTKTDVVYLQISGGMIELLHRAEPPADEAFGITHIAFLTNDLDGDYQKLVDAGYEGLTAPKVAGTGVGRLAFVRDPNGARVELLQRDVKMRDGVLDHAIVKSFDHYSLIANNLEGALDFYHDKLGMDVLKTVNIPATELEMNYLNYGYDLLELLHRPIPSKDPIFAHIALRVDNVDDALARFATQGVPAEAGTPKPAGTGIGRIGVIRDPDGVKIELLDRPDIRDL